MIRALPAAYATPLGHWFDSGRELSAGEWQRLALSRLFVRSTADILVIDEPTANLDPTTEQEVLRRLHQHSHGRLAVLVSHRAAWPEAAGIVAVLDGGKLVSCEVRRAGVDLAPAPTN